MAKMKVDKRALAAQHAVSRDPLRFVLHCVQVTPRHVVGTDGKVLVRVPNEAAQPDDAEGEVLLTKEAMAFVRKMFGAGGSMPVTLETAEGGATLKAEGAGPASGHVKLEVRHPEGKFPEYDKVVPSDVEPKFVVGVAILEKALKVAKAAGSKALRFSQKKGNDKAPVVLKSVDGGDVEIVMMPRRF